MKRFAALAVALLLLLASCGDSDQHREAITGATAETNLLQCFEADFFVEITFDSSRATLLYRNGSFSIDREAERLYCVDSQTLLGTSAKVITFCEDGVLYRESGKNKTASDTDAAEVFASMPYMPMPEFAAEDIYGIEQHNADGSTQYIFNVKNADDFMRLASAGDEIYKLAMLNKPQKDKTQFSDLKCNYIIGSIDGKDCVTSRQYSFDMTLYDTPPYAAGANIDPDDYKLELNFRIRIKVRSAPVSVEIPAFDASEYIKQ